MSRQRVRYFDGSGAEVSEHEATCNGCLKSGFSVRVPTTLADAARSFWDHHRDALVVTDARAIGGVEGCKPGFRVSDSPINRQAIADARAEYLHDLQNAWRNPLRLDAAPPPDPDEDEDDEDEDEDELPQGKRVRPVTADRRTVDQIAHDHFAAMERLYAARNREISEAWREGKATNG